MLELPSPMSGVLFNIPEHTARDFEKIVMQEIIQEERQKNRVAKNETARPRRTTSKRLRPISCGGSHRVKTVSSPSKKTSMRNVMLTAPIETLAEQSRMLMNVRINTSLHFESHKIGN
jgi:hypothetical protein